MDIHTRFDEVHFTVTLAWTGQPFEVTSSAPSVEDMIDDPNGPTRLGGYLVGRLADQVTVTEREGQVEAKLVFNA